jgi:hypothetical protein
MSKHEPFDDLKYTRKKIRRQLEVIQEHASDGSAFQNCRCIQEKHLDMLAEYATEGATIASDLKEKAFYGWLAPWSDATLDNVNYALDLNNDAVELKMWSDLADDAREIRRELVSGAFEAPNPASTRAYLPHGLTIQEKKTPETRHLLSRCIQKVEKAQCPPHFVNYTECKVNPVAVCRASVKVPVGQR